MRSLVGWVAFIGVGTLGLAVPACSGRTLGAEDRDTGEDASVPSPGASGGRSSTGGAGGFTGGPHTPGGTYNGGGFVSTGGVSGGAQASGGASSSGGTGVDAAIDPDVDSGFDSWCTRRNVSGCQQCIASRCCQEGDACLHDLRCGGTNARLGEFECMTFCMKRRTADAGLDADIAACASICAGVGQDLSPATTALLSCVASTDDAGTGCHALCLEPGL